MSPRLVTSLIALDVTVMANDISYYGYRKCPWAHVCKATLQDGTLDANYCNPRFSCNGQNNADNKKLSETCQIFIY